MPRGAQQRERQRQKELEQNFNNRSAKAPLPSYDALRDSNLRQYFEGSNVQSFLHSMGWIDREGRIIDLDKHKSRLAIIEQEFKFAEKAELWRQQEEEAMRKMIQLKRQRALEDAKRAERQSKMREERRLRQRFVKAIQTSRGMVDAGQIGKKSARTKVTTAGTATTSDSIGLYDQDAEEMNQVFKNTLAMADALEAEAGDDPSRPTTSDSGGAFFITIQR